MTDDHRMVIGRRLRHGRYAREMNVAALSEHVGLPEEMIREIECGAVDGRFVEVLAIAVALDVDLTELLSVGEAAAQDGSTMLRDGTGE